VLPLQLPGADGQLGEPTPHQVVVASALDGAYCLFCIKPDMEQAVSNARHMCPALMRCSAFDPASAAQLTAHSDELFFSSLTAPLTHLLMPTLELAIKGATDSSGRRFT
jgi:hypothetical protein